MWIYRGTRLNKVDSEEKSDFYVMPSGDLYEGKQGSTARRVGKMGKDGTVTVKKKYAKKYGHRLKQILVPKDKEAKQVK